MLKGMGIGVIFEKEGFNTLYVKHEFIITIYSCLAQAESESHSGNVKWGRQKSFKNGNVPFSYGSFLGYRKGADGKPEIAPEDAKTVRRIYQDFLLGQSRKTIAAALTADGILTPMGKSVWSSATVTGILKNEKYKGDAILQKSYWELIQYMYSQNLDKSL
jgi:DNA invertase Pin-like site-specific DNA recombinase